MAFPCGGHSPILKDNYQGLDDVHMLKAAVEENVLVQIENLRTHPSVAAKLAVGALHLARVGLQD